MLDAHIKDKYSSMKSSLVLSTKQRDNQMMASLSFAIKDRVYEKSCLILYGDVVFDTHVLRILNKSSENISIVVDTNSKRRYELRNRHVEKNEPSHFWENAAEKVWINTKDNKIKGIGMFNRGWEKVKELGELAGLMKLSENGLKIFKAYMKKYNEDYQKGKLNKNIFTNGEKGRDLNALYIAEFLQYLIEENMGDLVRIYEMDLDNRLYEFDTPSDVKCWIKDYKKDFIWDSQQVEKSN